MQTLVSEPRERDPESSRIERIAERIRKSTLQERVELLIRAGVLTRDGKVAERFRPLVERDDER